MSQLLTYGCVMKNDYFENHYSSNIWDIEKKTGIPHNSIDKIFEGKGINYNEFMNFVDGYNLSIAEIDKIFGFYCMPVASKNPILKGEYKIKPGLPKSKLIKEMWMQNISKNDINRILANAVDLNKFWECKHPLSRGLQSVIASYMDCEVKELFY